MSIRDVERGSRCEVGGLRCGDYLFYLGPGSMREGRSVIYRWGRRRDLLI